MNESSINDAIEILLNNFSSYTRLTSSSIQYQCDSGMTPKIMNPSDVLQEFWQNKCKNEGGNDLTVDEDNDGTSDSNNSNIVYEYLETPGPPCVCFVTLPGGACFATFQVLLYIFSITNDGFNI
jgi:hypothetical protein